MWMAGYFQSLTGLMIISLSPDAPRTVLETPQGQLHQVFAAVVEARRVVGSVTGS